MTIVYVFIGLLILILILLLFARIRFYINTTSKSYTVQLGYLVKAGLEEDKVEIIKVRMNVLGYKFNLFPLRKKKKKVRKKELQKKSSRKKGINRLRLMPKVLKAITIKEFEWNLDTGNYVTNAKLYPLFGFLSHHFAKCNINFNGKNSLVIKIESRPITILKSFVHF